MYPTVTRRESKPRLRHAFIGGFPFVCTVTGVCVHYTGNGKGVNRTFVAARRVEKREKTSFAITPKVKLALENLKLRLRRAGMARSTASEAAILETLILNADFDLLLDQLSR